MIVAWIVAGLEGTVAFGGVSAIGAGLMSIGIPKDIVAARNKAITRFMARSYVSGLRPRCAAKFGSIESALKFCIKSGLSS